MVRYLKRLKSSKFVRVKAFPMYGGMGVSAPSLHRESTDSLIVLYTVVQCCFVVTIGYYVKAANKSVAPVGLQFFVCNSTLLSAPIMNNNLPQHI